MQKGLNRNFLIRYGTAYSNATAYTEYVMAIKDINTKMTYNAVHAADELFKHLEFFVLQTGTNVSSPQRIID
jgi:hypothetical protein